MTLSDALLAVLMYWPDQMARGMAQDQLTEVDAGRDANKKLLGRIVMLLGIAPERAQHSDVWRAKPVIEAAAKGNKQ